MKKKSLLLISLSLASLLLASYLIVIYHSFMNHKQIGLFQKKLLNWYKKSARDLPWRKNKDPYKIWVSEIMLQQTQVDTVIPYYQKWLKRFPTLQLLAKAPQSEVMKYWAGLGYYRRARFLHQAAQHIVKNLKGKFPQSAETLRKLPGIGRYTAGAIASIAFGEKTPILDGNVIRILTRLNAIKKDISLTKTQKQLWQIAESILPNKNIGDFNQALMELGATVCFPDHPDCSSCPVTNLCQALALKRQTDFPVNHRKEKIEKKKTFAMIFRKSDSVLIQKQSDRDRWGGLWTFPHWDSEDEMLEESGLDNKDLKSRLSVSHGFTKYQVTLNVYETLQTANMDGKLGEKSKKWVRISDLEHFAFPSPHQKIVKDLRKK